MKHQFTPLNLASHLHRPLRFGRICRGHELPLRIVQIVLIVSLAIMGAQLVAHLVSGGVSGLIDWFH